MHPIARAGLIVGEVFVLAGSDLGGHVPQRQDERPLGYAPGDVTLPAQLMNSTVLVGAGPNVLDLGLVGTYFDLPGRVENDTCKGGNVKLMDIGAFASLLREDVKPPPLDLTDSKDPIFNEIIERQSSASAGFLFFATTMSERQRAEVVIETVASQSISNLSAVTDPAKRETAESKPLTNSSCGRYVIQSVSWHVVRHRIYGRDTEEAGVTSIIKIRGDRYKSYSRQSNNYFVTLNLRSMEYGVPGLAAARSRRTSPKPPTQITLVADETVR